MTDSRSAVPFHLKRSREEFGGTDFTTTKERVDGLLVLERDHLRVQWRLARTTERIGAGSMRTDRELEGVREVRIPLASVAGARVRRRWWEWQPRLVLRAADLQAFDVVAGEEGLALDHPAELVLRLRRADRLSAEEFAAELALAVAQWERPLPPGEEPGRLPPE